MAIKKHAHNEVSVRFSCMLFDLGKQLLLSLVDYVFNLTDRHIKLFCKWLVIDAVKQSSLEDCPVPFIVNPLVYEVFNLRPGQIL